MQDKHLSKLVMMIFVLKAELLNLRHELAELGATNKILREENHDILMQLHASQLKLHNNSSNIDVNDINDAEKIREKLVSQFVS